MIGDKLDRLSGRGFTFTAVSSIIPLAADWNAMRTLIVAVIAYIIGA